MVSDTGVSEEKIQELSVTLWLLISLWASSLWHSGRGAGKGRKACNYVSGIWNPPTIPLWLPATELSDSAIQH